MYQYFKATNCNNFPIKSNQHTIVFYQGKENSARINQICGFPVEHE